LRQSLGPGFVGIYLHGSGAMGGFHPRESDVDLIAVSREPLPEKRKRVLAESVSHAALACPARGLELHVLTLEQAGNLVEAPRFELYLETGADRARDEVNLGWNQRRADGGDTDLVMHLAVLRHAGVALEGPPPSLLFPEVPDSVLRRAFLGELRWAAEHGPPDYQVLNACRIWRYFEEGHLCSKIEGGEWALGRAVVDSDLVQVALAKQRGDTLTAPEPGRSREFVAKVLDQLHRDSPGRVDS
jgi:predicted nucleotidyltransferase